MSDLDGLVARSSAAISALISKPKMTEKLLSKPPFRFLHDIVSAITATTGFAEGLFQDGELDSAGITDKQAKMDYLDKIFNFVGICLGTQIDVRSLKVVAGLEAENTNMFLISLAEVASDPSYDSTEALRRAQAGEMAGSGPPARKKTGSRAEAKESSNSRDDAKGADESKSSLSAAAPSGFDAKLVAETSDPSMERGKSRGGTRGGKPPSHSANDVGLSSPVVQLDGELERCDGSFALSQTMLGELITKPKLTDKLLSKPPFRFLYDIVMEVSRATGFGTGLFSPEEWDSAQVNSREQKVQYLDKIITLVGVQLNTLVSVKSAKIVSGLDAEDTNRFLQYLAVAAKHVPDSRAAVRSVLEQMGLPVNEAELGLARGAGAGQGVGVAPAAAAAAAKPTSAAEEKPSPRSAAAPSGAKGDHHAHNDADEKGSSAAAAHEDDDRAHGRPMTARRRPPKVKEGAKEVDKKEQAAVPRKAEGIMTDGADEVDDEEDVADDTRLADDLADSKMGGTGAGAQSKLVQDILGRQAEAEAARNPKGGNAAAATTGAAEEDRGGDDAGKGGIRLGRLRKTGADKKGSGPTSASSASSAVFTEADIERLRAAIQGLVQHTGPLGSCLDFLQEDVGLMTAELRRWEEETRKYEARAEAERQRSEEKLHPLLTEVAAIDEQIAEQIAKISSTKAHIARNEERVVQLLRLMSSA